MSAAPAHKPIVHFVGSIPLPDAETVFRTLAAAAGPHLKRLPDGETGIRKTWIRFLQQVLADNPAIEVASDVPPFKFTQWDGKLLREIPRLRVKTGGTMRCLQRPSEHPRLATHLVRRYVPPSKGLGCKTTAKNCYLSSQTSSMRQPLKMLLTMTVHPLT